jgi:hypothetical protein
MRNEAFFEQRRFRGGPDGPHGPHAEHGDGPHEGHRGGPRGGRRGHGPGRGFRGGWQQADLPPADEAPAWLKGRLPDDWFVGEPTVSVDREEIVVTGELAPPDGETGQQPDAAAAEGRIQRFREDSREARVRIADEAQARYGRKVAWGASIGDTQVLFTHLAVPTMTRLRHDERRVLDTLVDAGVARSRSDALAWCVRLVGEHTQEWLQGLREAMTEVDKLRAEGPNL